MKALSDVQGALMAHLRAQDLPVLGSPVRVWDQPPRDPVFPYVAFGRVAAQSIGGIGPEVSEQVITLSAVSHFGGAEEAKAIADALGDVLDGVDVVTDAVRLSVRVSYVDVFRSSDLETTYALIRLRVVSEAT